MNKISFKKWLLVTLGLYEELSFPPFLPLAAPNTGTCFVEKSVENARRRAKMQCALFPTVNKGHRGSITQSERSTEEISPDVIVQIDLNYSTDC